MTGEMALAWVVIMALLLFVYFLPTLVAQGKPQFGPVFVVNLFLGWTLVFWVAALAWAVYPAPTRRGVS